MSSIRFAFLVSLIASAFRGALSTASQRPNFVFIISDDQDLKLNSLDYQPLLSKHLREQGTTFRNHFCTIAVCCPSRVSLLTGKAAHNTNVTDVKAPYGGYPKFVQEGWNESWLPLWLQQAGYNTYYVGKLMNGHNTTNYNSPHPSGWNGSDFLLDPWTYRYYNSTFQRNTDSPIQHSNEYSTDLVAQKSLGFLEEAAAAEQPFFLGIAPIGPHSETIFESDGTTFLEPQAAKRHEDLFPNATVPRGESFNPIHHEGVSWLKELPYLNSSVVAYNDYFYRRRLQALQAVDELIQDVVDSLESKGLLNNTYIIYTSDNGYHIGQHRLPPGKSCGFDEDIHVPFFVRGPGVQKNLSLEFPTTHTDIAPTIFDLAGIDLRDDFDGTPIPVRQADSRERLGRYEAVNVEFWGTNFGEGIFAGLDYENNTYKLARVVGSNYSLAYSVWCTNERELYDTTTDPYQIRNLLSPSLASTFNTTTLLGHPLTQVTARLDSLLMVLKSCKGDTCVHPWKTLHPAGNVGTLLEALDPLYDSFYEEQNRVSFSACELGYIRSAEGAQDVLPWSEVEVWAEMS